MTKPEQETNLEIKRPKVDFIVLIGRPGSGKDTQGLILTKKIPNSYVISTGDIVRGSQDSNSPWFRYNEKIKNEMENSNNGGLVSDKVILEIVNEVVDQKIGEGIDTIIFTGFPRTENQLIEFDKIFSEATYIELRVSREKSIERAQVRMEEDSFLKRPHRPDDLKIIKRNDVFDSNTEPMIKKLKDRIKVINGEHTIEKVTQGILVNLPMITRSGQVI